MMTRSFFLLLIFLILSGRLQAQTKWFFAFHDSSALVVEAAAIAKQFKTDVNRIDATLAVNPEVVLNTQPFLIFYSPKTNRVNLPLWQQLSDESRNFFLKMAGSEKGAEELFGLFFNGFYLAHELGHALQKELTQYKGVNNYDREYLANVIGMLWWRKQGRTQELEQCYTLAKKLMQQLQNPVPPGQTAAQYFTQNYEAAGRNPFVYGYMQFGQFIQIYEDASLGDFDKKIGELLQLK